MLYRPSAAAAAAPAEGSSDVVELPPSGRKQQWHVAAFPPGFAEWLRRRQEEELLDL